MKGLELSQLYYTDIIAPFLKKYDAQLSERIAAGLVGEGSECFGFDDEYSRDHDWGAAVCLWMDQADFAAHGEQLAEELRKLPDEYLGFPVCRIPGRNGVLSRQAFFRKFLRTDHVPETIGEWLSIPEAWLATASNGMLFHDPTGEFADIWNALRMGYPEDIRLKRIAYHCMQIGQAGQYNYPRLVQREECVAAEMALGEFAKEVMSVVYLLNHKYAPFYKWMHRGLQSLVILGTEVSCQLKCLLKEKDKQGVIEEICELLIMEFHRQDISEEQDFFMVRQGADIHAHISIEALRQTDPWMEIGNIY